MRGGPIIRWRRRRWEEFQRKHASAHWEALRRSNEETARFGESAMRLYSSFAEMERQAARNEQHESENDG